MHSAKALRLSPPETASPGCRLPVHPPTWPTKPALRINCDAAWPAPRTLAHPAAYTRPHDKPRAPNRTSPAPSRTRPTPQAEPGPPPKQNQAHPQSRTRPTPPDRTGPPPTRHAQPPTQPGQPPKTEQAQPSDRTSPALPQNQARVLKPVATREALGVVPRGTVRAIGEARHRRAKIRATPGGYGGKPPGVAIIGVPTGARNAGSGALTGDQSTDMNATRKHPLVCQDPIATRSRQGG